MDINTVSSLTTNAINNLEKTAGTHKTNALGEVGDTFSNVLNSLNESQQNSDNLLQTLASGGDVDLHTVTIASEENDVNFRVAMAIRDKLVDAYREVMRMSV